MDFSLILLPLAIVLLIFMMFNSRKRMQKMKAEQDAKQRQTVPGAEVMLNSGIFGTIVAFDPDDLDKPAEIEIAPGVVVKAHSQAIARIVDPTEEPALAAELADLPDDHPDHIPAEAASESETFDVDAVADEDYIADKDEVDVVDAVDVVDEASADEPVFDADEMKTYQTPQAETADEARVRLEDENKQD